MSSIRERIMAAAHKLATEKPLDRIGLSEVARTAGVSWPTVKRHVGSKEELRRVLVIEHPELAEALPDTRRRLLDAAVRVFARDGYEGATLEQIAKEAGMTKGAVYWHFEAKSEVFGALIEEYERKQAELAARDAEEAAASGQPHLALERLLSLPLRRAQQSPEWSKLLFEFVSRGARTRRHQSMRVVLNAVQQAATGLYRKLHANGHAIADVDSEAVGTVVAAVVHGLLLAWVVDPHRSDPTAMAPIAARLLWKGISG
jgi:AcrR family transcriptional regulator